MQKARRLLKWLIYTVLGLIADTLDIMLNILQPPTIPKISLQGSEIDSLSDTEILEMFQNSSKPFDDSGALKLLPVNIVVKVSFDPDPSNIREELVHNLLFEQTSIPVPRMRRVIPCDIGVIYAMDYIPGQSLDKVWDSLSVWQKIWIIFTLRRYVQQLHRIKATPQTPPGGLTNTTVAKDSMSHLWGPLMSEKGPFDSSDALFDFLDQGSIRMANAQQLPSDSPIRHDLVDRSEPLVLTHNDLHMGNIVLADDGRLWIIDWAWAGYHPKWFEYVGVVIREGSWSERNLWKRSFPFICGPYFEQQDWHNERAYIFVPPMCESPRLFASSWFR
ncbi:hypothetical protein H0H93_013794 [Arthromyces matolae]|nr:hypothetical protein H0H93_013794 [Arthromyces matolae]